MQQIITKMKSDGVLDISPVLLKKLINKRIKIIYDIEKEAKTKDAKDFIELSEFIVNDIFSQFKSCIYSRQLWSLGELMKYENRD